MSRRLSGDQVHQETAIERGGDGQQEFEAGAELRCCFQDRGQVHAYFFDAASGQQRNPRFGNVEMRMRGVVVTFDRGVWEFGERMADESSVHAAIAVELLLEGKNYESFADVIADEADASLAPRPELWCNVIDRRDAAPFHLAGNAPVERRGIDDNGEVGLA